MPDEQKTRTLARRLLWFVLLWLGGGTVALVSFGLKPWIAPK